MTLHFRRIEVYRPPVYRRAGGAIVGAIWAGLGALLLGSAVAGLWAALLAWVP